MSSSTAAFVRVWFEVPGAGLTSSLVSISEGQNTMDLVQKVQAFCERRDLGDLRGAAEDQRFLLCMPSKSHALFTFPANMQLHKAAKRAPIDKMIVSGVEINVCAGILMSVSDIQSLNPKYEDHSKTASAIKIPAEFKEVLEQMLELNNKDNAPNVIKPKDGGGVSVPQSPIEFAGPGSASGSGFGDGQDNADAPAASDAATPSSEPKETSGSTSEVPEGRALPPKRTPRPQPVTEANQEGAAARVVGETSASPPINSATDTPAPSNPPTGGGKSSPTTPKLLPSAGGPRSGGAEGTVAEAPVRRAAVPLQESLDSIPTPVPVPTMAPYGIDGLLDVSLRVPLPNCLKTITLTATVHYYRGDFAQEVVYAALARLRSEGAVEAAKLHGECDVHTLRNSVPTDASSLMLAVSVGSNNNNNSANTQDDRGSGITDLDDVAMFTADDPLPILTSSSSNPKARLVIAPASIRRARSLEQQQSTANIGGKNIDEQNTRGEDTSIYFSPAKVQRVLKVAPSVRDDPAIDYQNRTARCVDLEKHLAALSAELDQEASEIEILEKDVMSAQKERDDMNNKAEDARAAVRDCERLENLKSWLERELGERVEYERSVRSKLYISSDE